MRPNPNYFHLRSSTSITLDERFSRLNQKKPQNYTPPIRRGGIQKPRASNVRNLRGRLNQMGSNRNNLNISNAHNNSHRGTISNRRGLSRPGLNRGGLPWKNMSPKNSNSFNVVYSRGNFRGRGRVNMGRGGRRLTGSSMKTPEQTKEELDAELDAYMHND